MYISLEIFRWLFLDSQISDDEEVWVKFRREKWVTIFFFVSNISFFRIQYAYWAKLHGNEFGLGVGGSFA